MSRQVYLLGVGLGLIALAFATTDHVLSRLPGVTEANVKRIRTGVSDAEVIGLLGGPGIAADEEEFLSETEFEEFVEEIEDSLGLPQGSTLRPGWPDEKIDWDGLDIRSWRGPSGTAKVVLRHGRVLLAGFFPAARPSLFQRLLSGH